MPRYLLAKHWKKYPLSMVESWLQQSALTSYARETDDEGTRPFSNFALQDEGGAKVVCSPWSIDGDL